MATVEWPMRGRDAELAVIRAAVDGPGRPGVLLTGPQGIGRSRLAHEARRLLDAAGRPHVWASGSPAAAGIPFGALAHLLPDSPPDRPTELLRQAATVVRRRGLAFVIDDAHLLDDVSAAFIHHVAVHDLGDLVLTARSDVAPADPVTALWKDAHVERLDLGPLDPSATEVLLEEVLGGRLDPVSLRRLWQTTRGNPLFLREVVRASLVDGSLERRRGVWRWDGAFSVSPCLADLVRSRLAIEDEVLELVAWGEPLPLWLAERIAGRTAVERSERAGLLDRALDADDTVLRFGHPVYREVLRSTTTPRWRSVWRGRRSTRSRSTRLPRSRKHWRSRAATTRSSSSCSSFPPPRTPRP